MAYRVDLSGLAVADAHAAFELIRALAPLSADRWLNGLFAVFTLSDMPARCPVLPEAVDVHAPLRHLLFGRRSASYRVTFEIQGTESTRCGGSCLRRRPR